MTQIHARRRTPYDTGRRLEPIAWVHDGVTGQSNLRRAVDDDYGRVDFDDSEAATLVTLWIECDDDGTHHLHLNTDLDLQIHHHD
ncbi:hypothetical protein JRG18_12330 [Kocuria palustris]|uniref:hypothetical protein n=1 Tax=Kocuria palustris TaxID=71999 RepID=UPI0019D06604|nr:hypothetical protein [Kocuria palustris]MBN6754286.1 hypothetical protein [Kocuria palustris]MBN6759240.1 hypothetical protein [Kocuria palustris]MBN6764280.1 hypothetical protein [Kocuria palustris]MBN6783765.1 hypothetical protein [Kocuria palustris]MBN6800247.1 hypothetical protein [Kocuria palustris]